ncbi:hypothetical protein EZS27_020514 [termite gut metagenome]|uniref:Uncharacterized protein n=1 Tax=termite gut metagenome TaxID=433724 RepID=A0A5J4RA42_9ZZZZ
MKRIIITEEQYKKYLLQEDMGVSDEVMEISRIIVEKLRNRLPAFNKESQKEAEYSSTFAETIRNYSFIGELSIYYTFIKSEENVGYSNRSAHIDVSNAEIISNTKQIIGCKIHLSIPIVNGDIYPSSLGSISHEITHLYQLYMRLIKGYGNKVIGKSVNLKVNRNLYDFTIKYFSNCKSNTIEFAIYLIIHQSFQNEINSDVNGLYALLTDYVNKTPNISKQDLLTYYEKSNFYLTNNRITFFINEFKKFIDKGDVYGEEYGFKEIFDFMSKNGFPMNLESLMQIGENGLAYINNKYYRVIQKIITDNNLI